jgi:serine/threonine-protein kinase SRPK3
MKVLSAECYGGDTDIFELEILQHLRLANVEHAGYPYISSLTDSFKHEGPNGVHVCLVFKVMGESLSTFRDWFPGGQMPAPLVQRFATQLLKALDYAHECGVVHTGDYFAHVNTILILYLQTLRHSTRQYHGANS